MQYGGILWWGVISTCHDTTAYSDEECNIE